MVRDVFLRVCSRAGMQRPGRVLTTPVYLQFDRPCVQIPVDAAAVVSILRVFVRVDGVCDWWLTL